MQEIWKDIIGYEGLYQVSNLGRIKSIGRKSNHKNSIIMNPFVSNKRYFSVYLHKNNESKRTFVHRIVAVAFISNPENKPYVNHINGNRFDNRASNLEWCTCQENNSHAYRTGLNKGYSHWNGITGENNPHSIPVFQIDKNQVIVNTFCSAKEASELTGISRRMISNCCNGTKNQLVVISGSSSTKKNTKNFLHHQSKSKSLTLTVISYVNMEAFLKLKQKNT